MELQTKHFVGTIVLAAILYLVKDEVAKMLRQGGWLG